jgi:hypothetical protein
VVDDITAAVAALREAVGSEASTATQIREKITDLNNKVMKIGEALGAQADKDESKPEGGEKGPQ